MKKIELIELLQERNGKSVSPGMCNTALGRAFNQLLYDTFRTKLGSYDSYAKKYENLDVKYSYVGEFYYTNLPAKIIQLPETTDGIRNITTPRGTAVTFVPISERQNEIMRDLEVSEIGDQNIPIGFMLSKTGDIEFIKYQNGKISDIKKVALLLLVPIEDLEMDDEIKIPSGKDVELLNIAIQILTGMMPNDNVNDANTKTL